LTQPVSELIDLQNRPIEGEYYNYELLSVGVKPQTGFEIVRTRNKSDVKQHLVKWKGYETFNPWIKATNIKKI